MKVVEIGNWKAYLSPYFGAYTRSRTNSAILERMLEQIHVDTNYSQVIFLREARGSVVEADYLAKDQDNVIVKRRIYELKWKAGEPVLKKLRTENVNIRETLKNIGNYNDFFEAMLSFKGDYLEVLRKMYYPLGIDVEELSPFIARLEGHPGDMEIAGVMLRYAYTKPEIEYVINTDNLVYVSDAPIKDSIKKVQELRNHNLPGELHVIASGGVEKYMLFINVGERKFMLPPSDTLSGLREIKEKLRIFTITRGIPRVMKVDPTNKELLESVIIPVEEMIGPVKNVYLKDNKTTFETEKMTVTVFLDTLKALVEKSTGEKKWINLKKGIKF
jgi:hypothetical protein